MNQNQLALEGLAQNFKVEKGQLLFLAEDGKIRSTRPATWIEGRMWESIQGLLADVESVKNSLRSVDEDNIKLSNDIGKLSKKLRGIPNIETESLQDPVKVACDLVSSWIITTSQIQDLAEYLDYDFPGQLNVTEGVFGTARRLLRSFVTAKGASEAKQRADVAARAAHGVRADAAKNPLGEEA